MNMPAEIMARPRFQSEAVVDSKPLSESLTFEFSGRTVTNRLLKAAITERMATWHVTDLERRGIPTRQLINVYRRWGEAGFGLMLTGNLMIELDQLESAGNLVIPRGAPFKGERFDAFRELVAAGKKHGSLFVVQLSHPGRQTYSKFQPAPISASDVQLVGGFRGVTFAKPRPMEEEDFKQVIEGFAHAAEYAHAAGFDGVQIHAAHGYLLSQFLAHTTNKRTDQYGGSLKNRSRIIFDISNEIRARVPDKSFILCIKLNSVEFQSGGFTPDDCKALCVDLEEHGFDFVELSGGTYEANAFHHQPDVRESTKAREAFFLEFADQITPLLKKTKVYITGGLRTVHGMVRALETVDGVGLARPICHEFDLSQKILANQAQGGLSYLLDERNYMLTDVAAGSQVRLVGEDKEPLDMTSEEHMKIFNALMDNWLEALEVDKKGAMSGWLEIDSKAIERPPYGTVA